MPVLSLACHLPHNTPNIPSRYNNEQTTKQTKAINNSYIYISHVNVTQTVPDISPLMPMHQDPLLVTYCGATYIIGLTVLISVTWRKWMPMAMGYGDKWLTAALILQHMKTENVCEINIEMWLLSNWSYAGYFLENCWSNIITSRLYQSGF